jgi:hypothetical protein
VFITDGKALGFENEELREYVGRCRSDKLAKDKFDVEERKLIAGEERDKRAHDREIKQLKLKKIEADLELARINVHSNDSHALVVPSSKSFIKLSNYKDGDDVAVYFKTFEKVCAANCWNDAVSMSALINGFSGTKICNFISTLASDLPYDNVKLEIIKAFGLTIYNYQHKFHFTKQSNESFRQYVLGLKENLSKMCELAHVDNDYQRFEDLIVKDQILYSVSRSLAEFLKERDIFKMSLDDVIQLADNYQSIHGRLAPKPRQSIHPNTASNISDGDRKCFQCYWTGHIAKYCRVKLSNYVYDDCKDPFIPSKPKAFQSNSTGAVRTCYSCRKMDHYAKFCNNANRENIDC